MESTSALRPLCFAAFLTSLGAGGLLAPRPAGAQTPAVGFTSDAIGVEDNAGDTTGSPGDFGNPGPATSYSLGYEFTATGPSFVTSLGYFSDPSYAGPNLVNLSPATTAPGSFADSHLVGLFQVVPGVAGTPETGILLAQATVTNSSTRNGDFLYTGLSTSVPLIGGNTYVLAGVSGSTDPYVYDVQNSSGGVGMTQNGISYVQDRYDISSSLIYPTQTDPTSEAGFFGPNMTLSATPGGSAAPEPSEWTVMGLIALGLGTLGLRARRARTGRPGGATAE